MRGLRAVLTIVDAIVWVFVGYLIYQSAGLVFGKIIGQGFLYIFVVALLSVIGTSLSIRALGRSFVRLSMADDMSATFSVWMSRLFLMVMLVSFVIWDSYAIWVGLDIVYPKISHTIQVVSVSAFSLYTIGLVINYKSIFENCPSGNAHRR